MIPPQVSSPVPRHDEHEEAESAVHHRQWLSARALFLAGLWVSLLTGALSHGYFLFNYPAYLGDEGIYVQQAWSVLAQGELSPYTYWYDHAPAGWLFTALWAFLLPWGFDTFGTALDTSRVLMLLVHIANVYLLFIITRRLSKSTLAAVVAAFFFSLSPLAVYYQRQVLLDNIMVFWILLSLYLLARGDRRIATISLSGVAFGLAVLTKENAIFFAPAFLFFVYMQTKGARNHHFTRSFWGFTSLAVISSYFVYAALQSELFPPGMNFSLSHAPEGHVSLLYTAWWHLNRSPETPFWDVAMQDWIQRDAFIIFGGILAILLGGVLALRNWREHWVLILIALLAASHLFYLTRSIMLSFYIVPLIPFLAMSIGMILSHVLKPFQKQTKAAVLGICAAILVSPVGGYIFVTGAGDNIALGQAYSASPATFQKEQLSFVVANIPPGSNLIISDELWVDLHNHFHSYEGAHSYWKAAGDPEIRDGIFQADWRNIDYFVLPSHITQHIMTQGELSEGQLQFGWLKDGIENARVIWEINERGIALEVLEVVK